MTHAEPINLIFNFMAFITKSLTFSHSLKNASYARKKVQLIVD